MSADLAPTDDRMPPRPPMKLMSVETARGDTTLRLADEFATNAMIDLSIAQQITSGGKDCTPQMIGSSMEKTAVERRKERRAMLASAATCAEAAEKRLRFWKEHCSAPPAASPEAPLDPATEALLAQQKEQEAARAKKIEDKLASVAATMAELDAA